MAVEWTPSRSLAVRVLVRASERRKSERLGAGVPQSLPPAEETPDWYSL